MTPKTYFDTPISRAVITVPALFQRRPAKRYQEGRENWPGFTVERIVN